MDLAPDGVRRVGNDMKWTKARLKAPCLGTIGWFAGMALLVSGCTTFNKEWQAAATQPVSAASPEGRWQGTWASDVNRHNGALRCIVTREGDNSYRARFHAKYQKVLGFGYTVTLHTQDAGVPLRLAGDANLGWWAGGVYHYEGTVGATNFFSTYSCHYDQGTFQMTRP